MLTKIAYMATGGIIAISVFVIVLVILIDHKK